MQCAAPTRYYLVAPRGPRRITEFHLNRKQAIYLTTQAGTPKAHAMTVFVVSG